MLHGAFPQRSNMWTSKRDRPLGREWPRSGTRKYLSNRLAVWGMTGYLIPNSWNEI